MICRQIQCTGYSSALECLLPEDGKTVITPSSILFKMCFLIAFCLSDKTAGSCLLQMEDEMALMISLLMQWECNSCSCNYPLYGNVRCIQFVSSCKGTLHLFFLMHSMVYSLSKPLESTHEQNFAILSLLDKFQSNNSRSQAE